MVDTIDGNTETDTVQAVSPGRVQASRHSGLLRAGRFGCRNRDGQRRQCRPSPSLDARARYFGANAALANRHADADGRKVSRLHSGAARAEFAGVAWYLWSYSIGAFEPIKAVAYDFAESRAGQHARDFLGDWGGTLVCDDYSGYKALIAQGVTEAGCMAHARRKFFELHTNHQSQIAGEALEYFQKLYAIERDVAELDTEDRRRLRQEHARPIIDEFYAWLKRRRLQVPNGSARAKAIDYSLRRWAALVHYLRDGQVPIDYNWIENRIRPIALGRKN